MNKIIDLLGLSEFKEKIISLIPTKVSQLDNDSEYVTQTEIENLKKSVSDGKELVADAITGKGVETATDATFTTMAENIGQIETGNDIVLQESKTVNPTTSVQNVIPDDGYDGLSKVTVNAMKLQQKSSKSNITDDLSTVGFLVAPDSGYDGLDFVGLSPVYAQKKTVSPSTVAKTITPDSGYDALSQVTVNAAKLQSKTVTPSASAQTIKPDSGYYGLSQVTVNAQSGEPSSVTIIGYDSIHATGYTNVKKNFTVTLNIPLTTSTKIVSGNLTVSSGTVSVFSDVYIGSISFEQATSVSMISEHMGVDLQIAQQMYNTKNVVFEIDENDTESVKMQKVSEVIAISKAISKNEKLEETSEVHDTVFSTNSFTEEGSHA